MVLHRQTVSLRTGTEMNCMVEPVMKKLLVRKLQDDDIHANHFLSTMRQTIDLFELERNKRGGPCGQNGADIVCSAAISHLHSRMAARLMIIGDATEFQPFNQLESLPIVAILLNDPNLLKYLIKKGVDIGKENKYFGSPFWLAAEEGHVEVMVELLKSGGSTNRSEYCAKALRSSCRRGHRSVVELLLDPRYQLEIAIEDYDWAIRNAAQAGHTGLVKYLIERTCVNHSLDLLQNVLRDAAAEGNKPLIQMMIEKGVDVNTEDMAGFRAIECAATRSPSSIISWLLSLGANLNYKGHYMSALHGAAKRGDETLANLLLDHGANINYSGHHGTPIWEAARHQHLGMIRLLLDRGADLNFEETGDECIYDAVRRGSEDVVRIFAEAGVDVNGPKPADSLILAAILNDQNHMREVLLELGARPIDPLQSPWADFIQEYKSSNRPWSPPLLDY